VDAFRIASFTAVTEEAYSMFHAGMSSTHEREAVSE
jgi:hypothetical protein